MARDHQPQGASARRAEIPIEEAIAVWRKDPDYVRAYEALEEEFARAAARIAAQDHDECCDVLAEKVERLLADEPGVDRSAYGSEVESK